MSSLSVYHVSSPELPNKVLTHFEDIAATLAEQGIRFERWPATTRLQPGASQEEVISAYQQEIDRLMTDLGYAGVEVLSLAPDHPQKDQQRAGFLAEQRQAGDEIRLFVAGRGLLSLHIDDYVYALLCERHDLLALPAGTAHWFDMGEQPQLVAIRLFKTPQSPVANLTGDAIASQFPPLED
ncbi:acireductone dioxygenase [Pseudomonas sp. NFXW11]|uniref:1,2-dihydroxy-3-keto-5-methylthiopentene dioxygenase n=1 Tax=Pseudomonas sp. NFXW11 TaxID=2819531 RepID=UPI003CFA5FBA